MDSDDEWEEEEQGESLSHSEVNDPKSVQRKKFACVESTRV